MIKQLVLKALPVQRAQILYCFCLCRSHEPLLQYCTWICIQRRATISQEAQNTWQICSYANQACNQAPQYATQLHRGSQKQHASNRFLCQAWRKRLLSPCCRQRHSICVDTAGRSSSSLYITLQIQAWTTVCPDFSWVILCGCKLKRLRLSYESIWHLVRCMENGACGHPCRTWSIMHTYVSCSRPWHKMAKLSNHSARSTHKAGLLGDTLASAKIIAIYQWRAWQYWVVRSTQGKIREQTTVCTLTYQLTWLVCLKADTRSACVSQLNCACRRARSSHASIPTFRCALRICHTLPESMWANCACYE